MPAAFHHLLILSSAASIAAEQVVWCKGSLCAAQPACAAAVASLELAAGGVVQVSSGELIFDEEGLCVCRPACTCTFLGVEGAWLLGARRR